MDNRLTAFLRIKALVWESKPKTLSIKIDAISGVQILHKHDKTKDIWLKSLLASSFKWILIILFKINLSSWSYKDFQDELQ